MNQMQNESHFALHGIFLGGCFWVYFVVAVLFWGFLLFSVWGFFWEGERLGEFFGCI